MHRLLIASGVAALLAACGSASHDTGQQPLAPPRQAAPVEDAVLAGGIIVSTNEPFLQARVEGGVLVLTGVDVGERRLAVERSDIDGGTRTIVARDGTGSVEARVRASACEDSMSGASFPFSGELTVDGDGPHAGCARPAAMAAPGEPAAPDGDAVLPAAFSGRWAPDEAACMDPANIETITIAADAIRFHESVGTPRQVHLEGDDAATVVFAYQGEGEQWEAEQRLRLGDADTLEIAGAEGLELHRVRCAR